MVGLNRMLSFIYDQNYIDNFELEIFVSQNNLKTYSVFYYLFLFFIYLWKNINNTGGRTDHEECKKIQKKTKSKNRKRAGKTEIGKRWKESRLIKKQKPTENSKKKKI